MSIPLVQNNEKDSINTSIIAIKRNIERINMLLGLSNSEEIDTSEFVKKSDIVDVVEAGNMNPVTSNAVVPVDEVTVGNMQSVSSDAVARAINNINHIIADSKSFDMNTLQHETLPVGFYVLSGGAGNYQHFAPVPATVNQRGCMIYIEVTRGRFTIQRVKTADFENTWFYYEYERYYIDRTWFSWRLIRKTQM